MWYFRSPRTIMFGPAALDYLKEIDGDRAIIVTDKTMTKLGFLELVTKKLESAGKEVIHYDGVTPEPPDTSVFECVKKVNQFKPDLIIGLGGGSAIDVAKASWVLYEYPDMPLNDITPFTTIKLTKAKLIAIPTTSGTGSETTFASVITDTKNHFKMELVNEALVPNIAIVDPTLTKTLPKHVIAAAGLDALAQAIDPYTNQWRNDFSDALAIHATKLILEYLPRVYKNPEDDEAREKLHNAATISGLAWSNAALGITHSFGHASGAIYKIPHGVSVGMVLPYSIEYSIKSCPELYGGLAKAVGLATPSDDDTVAALKLRDKIVDLMKTMNSPLSLKEYGITKKKFEETFDELVRLTEESTGNILNCREPTKEDFRHLWKYMFEGKSIDF
jgi:alcohol dehydrogenase class IV